MIDRRFIPEIILWLVLSLGFGIVGGVRDWTLDELWYPGMASTVLLVVVMGIRNPLSRPPRPWRRSH